MIELMTTRSSHPEQPREAGGLLRVAQVGGDDDAVAQVDAAEVGGQLVQGVQVVDRHVEEAVHLRGVQRHRQDAVGARRAQQVGHEAGADGDARGVLLVRAGVGEVRHDHGDPPGRRAPGGVEHEQQLDEVLLHRRHQRLDDEHVALAAVGLQLDLEAVVGEAGVPRRRQRHLQVLADGGGEVPVGRAAEDDDLAHAV
jgi:hypothetical protein